MTDLVTALTTFQAKLEATIVNNVTNGVWDIKTPPSYEVEIYHDVINILNALNSAAEPGATEATAQTIADTVASIESAIDTIQSHTSSITSNIDIPLSQVTTDTATIENLLTLIQNKTNNINIPLTDLIAKIGELKVYLEAIDNHTIYIKNNVDLKLSNFQDNLLNKLTDIYGQNHSLAGTFYQPSISSRILLSGVIARSISCQIVATSITDSIFVRLEGSNNGEDWSNLSGNSQDLEITVDGDYTLVIPQIKILMVRFNFVAQTGNINPEVRFHLLAGAA